MADQTRFYVKNWGIYPVLLAVVSLYWLLPNPAWTFILIVLIGLIGTCALWTWLLSRHLRSERRLTREWFTVGDRLIEQLAIHNMTWVPAVWLEFFDESTVAGYRPAVAYEVPANFSLHWRVMASCRQRGRYQLGPWQLRTGDPFGLFETTLDYFSTKEIVIFPPGDANISLSVELGELVGDINATKQSLQLTESVSTLRDYHQGDPLKWIHWPSTAHKGELMVRQFERNIQGDVWLLIDGNRSVQLGQGYDATDEISVLLAAALIENLADPHRQVGLMTFGRDISVVPPGDPLQQWRSQYQLAIFKADGQLPLAETILRTKSTLTAGSSLIIATPDDDPAILDALTALTERKINVTLLLLERASFGGRPTVNIDAYQREAVHRGHRVFPIKKGDIISPTYEFGKQEGFITTPLGRTIELNQPPDL